MPDSIGAQWFLLAIGSPIPIAVAIWLLLRVAHVPKAFVVSLLGTACMAVLIYLMLQMGLSPGTFWLPIGLLLTGTYVVIGRLVFPASAGSGTSQR